MEARAGWQLGERLVEGLRLLAHDLAAGLPLSDLLTSAIKVIRQVFKADRAAIFLGPPARPVATEGLSQAYLQAVVADYERGPGGMAMKSGKPVYIRDVRAAERPSGAVHTAAEAEGFRTMVVGPLVYAGRVLGGYSLYHDEVSPYSEHDLQLVELFAEHLALAVENARRQREREEQRQRCASILEQLPVGVLVTDRSGSVELANRTARVLLADDALSREIEAGRRRMVEEGGPAALDREEPVQHEIRVPAGTGRFRSYAVNARPIEGLSVVVLEDTTSRRELEILKDSFLQIASHELRSPLTTLKVYAAMLRERLSREEGREGELVNKLDAQVSRLARLVEQMLEVAALETGESLKRERMSLDEVVRAAIQRESRAEGSRQITFAGPLSVEVEGDRSRLERAILELLHNAIVHGAGPVEVEIEATGERAIVRVNDHGAGVAEERVPYLFDRFSAARGARPSGGLGLGLYVTGAIVRAHGGTMGYAPRSSGGASFWIELPRSRPRPSGAGR